jgi:hypothetical protein
MSGSPASSVPPRRDRLWWALGVTALLAFVVLGGYVVGGALSQPAGPTVDVGGVVRLQPLSGWELAGRSGDRVHLTRGSGSLEVVVGPFSGSAQDLAAEYVRRSLEPDADRLSVSSDTEPVRLASGLTGVRLTYVGRFGRSQTPIDGEVTAVVSPSGVGVVFDAWGPTGTLRYIADDARAMADAAQVA